MGCGESKHDVATGNTVSTRKKSNSDTKKSKDIETIPERVADDNNTNSPEQKKESEKANEELKSDKVGGDAADVKDIAENTELKEGETIESNEEKEGGVEEREPGRLISRDSPNHYFSSRKDDQEAIESVVSEGKSEYETPRHDNGKEDLLKETEKGDDAVEDKGLVEEAKAEVENGEPKNMNKESLVIEGEATTTIKAKISTTIGEEKNVNVGEEHLTDSSTKDPKGKLKENLG